MIDLEEKYIKFIKNVVSNHLTEYRIFMFGSRVKGTAKKYSDVDIAINSKNLTDKTKLLIEADLENSTIPYEVDVVDLNTISENFKKNIVNDLVEI